MKVKFFVGKPKRALFSFYGIIRSVMGQRQLGINTEGQLPPLLDLFDFLELLSFT
jgi:hypothetical protein